MQKQLSIITTKNPKQAPLPQLQEPCGIISRENIDSTLTNKATVKQKITKTSTPNRGAFKWYPEWQITLKCSLWMLGI